MFRSKRSRSNTVFSSSKDTVGEATIVLYLSAHGSQACERFRKPLDATVEVLSFVSQFGEEGLMMEAPLPDITVDSLDEVTLRISVTELLKVHHHRPFGIQRQHIAQRVAHCFTKTLPGMLQKLFLQSFANEGEETLRRFRKGFKVTAPDHDRMFQFKEHVGQDDSSYAPHYGIHILDTVTSSKRLAKFSVKHRPSRDDKESYFEFGNITHPDQTENIQTMIEAIRQIKDPQIQEDCMVIYYLLVEEASASLSDIAFLFRSLGFAHIFVLDPSCRSIPKSAPIALRVKARRESTDPVVCSPMLPEADLPLTQSQSLSADPLPISPPYIAQHVDDTLLGRIKLWFSWAPKRSSVGSPASSTKKAKRSTGGRTTRKRRRPRRNKT